MYKLNIHLSAIIAAFTLAFQISPAAVLFLVLTSSAEIIEVGNIDTPGNARGVEVRGDYVYIADGQSGLQIINISNPEDPENAGSLDTEGTTSAVAVRGNHAFLADGMGGLVIVDISDPAEPQALGELAIGGSLINDVAVSGDYAYLTDMVNGMRIISVSDPENPEQVSLFDTPDAPQGIFIAGDYAYIADRRSGLQIVDISDPEEPDAIGSCDTPGEANAVFVQDDYAYIADKAGGLRIIYVSDPWRTEEVGALNTDGLAYDVALNGHYAYIADGAGGFLAVNVRDPENPSAFGEFDTQGTSYGVAYADGYVFIADGESGLQIIQLTPEIAVSDEELDFGRVDVGECEELTLTISNEGHNDLIISDVTVEGLYFSCDFEDEVIIEPASNFELIVTFNPEWFGDFEGNLTIVSNDSQNAEINVDLLGFGNLDPDEEKITADDAAASDEFGISVSIDGDYAVVGAYGNDDDGANSGSAYIFVRDGEDWIQQAKLIADDAEAYDYFGFSVSISGRYAVVGAYGNADDVEMSGSAYIFVRDGDEWTQQAKLTANDADVNDWFGWSVSIDGDYAVIGAHKNNDDGRDSGSAYIFVRDGDDWAQEAKLTANDAGMADEFGISVFISGDYAVVGSPYSDDGGGSSGSAYIFVRDGDDWTQQAKLTANDYAGGDYFGISVSIDGDYAVVGAIGNDDDGRESGSAYIFVRDGNRWTQQAKLTANDAAVDNWFGNSVSIDGDYAVIGARGNDDDGFDSGSAYIFVSDGDDWTEQVKLTANDAAAGDMFGVSVSIDGNYAVVGAHYNDDEGGGSGSAYLYSLDLPGQPHISVRPSALDFGGVLTGSYSELELTINNSGEVDLRITGISINGNGFDVAFEEEFVIEPDNSEEVIVTFAPEDAREYNGSLIISSNDLFREEISVELTGIGLPASNVSLIEGWNLISINVSPGEEFYIEGEDRGPDVVLMLEQLRIDEENHHVEIFKNVDGEFYLPAWDYNGIAYWNLLEGFQIKVDEDIEATWSGAPIPFDADIPLIEGWNIIAYFPTYELDASAPDYYVLSPIIDHILIAKDADGAFMIPEWDYSNMPPWRETQGYQVKVDEDVVLNYPEEPEDGGYAVNSPPLNPPLLRSGGRASRPHWMDVIRTGDNMSVLINSIGGVDLDNIREIAAFNIDGRIVGLGQIDATGRCGLAVWGDDESTGEKEGLAEGGAFELRYLDASEDKEIELEVKAFHTGKGLVYETNSFLVIDAIRKAEIPQDYYLSQNYPNPFNSTTRIRYGLPEAGQVSLKVYDISGRVVSTIIDRQVTAGHHVIEWDARQVSSGLYLLQLEASHYKAIRKVVLTK